MSNRRIGGSTSVTVSDLATHYGTTAKFVVLALRRVGVDAQTSQDWLTPTVQAAFEDAYGERIRAARPFATQPPSAVETQASLGSREAPPANDSADERSWSRDAFSPTLVGGALKPANELTSEQIAQREAQRSKDRRYALPKRQSAERFPARGVEKIYLGGLPGGGRRS